MLAQGAVAVEGEAQLWRPAERRSLWDSTPLPPDDDDDDDSRHVSSSSSDAAHAPPDSPPISPRLPPPLAPIESRPTQSPAPVPAGQAMPLPGPVSVPESAQATGGTAGAADGQATIPYDWAISIDNGGLATVESGSGRLAVGSGQSRQPDQAPGAGATSAVGSSGGPSQPGAQASARSLGGSPGPGRITFPRPFVSTKLTKALLQNLPLLGWFAMSEVDCAITYI